MVFPRNQTSFCAWQSFQGHICRNSATFKTELFATIGNHRKLQKASSDELTTNGQYLHVAAQGGYCFLEYKFLVFPGIFQVLFLFFQLFFFSSKQDSTDVHVSEEKVLSYQQPLSKLIFFTPCIKSYF